LTVTAATTLIALLFAATANLDTEECDAACSGLSVHEDGTYSMGAASGKGRSTPVIDATVVDSGEQDIDGDGSLEVVIIDDRESAFGSVTAVYFDVSLGEPYIAFQCQASAADAVEAECPAMYQDFTPENAIRGTDIIYSGTRREGALDWETQHLAIPNWTTSIALTIAIMNVDLQRERHARTDSAETLAELEAALDLRELRALQFSLTD
jgi:hypothetical protein